jgi:hypothetical protein
MTPDRYLGRVRALLPVLRDRKPIHLAGIPRDQLSREIRNSRRFVRMRPLVRGRSTGTVATHKHPIQAAMLAVIVIEAGFMQ